jgi:hypothetical protein
VYCCSRACIRITLCKDLVASCPDFGIACRSNAAPEGTSAFLGHGVVLACCNPAVHRSWATSPWATSPESHRHRSGGGRSAISGPQAWSTAGQAAYPAAGPALPCLSTDLSPVLHRSEVGQSAPWADPTHPSAPHCYTSFGAAAAAASASATAASEAAGMDAC